MTDSLKPGSTDNEYSNVAKVLHWVLAAMIIMQVILAQLAKRAAQDDNTFDRLTLLANHKSIGLTVLLLVILRVAWRLTHRPPALPEQMTRWQRLASHLSHFGLYVLMLTLPLSGWLVAATSKYGMSWFNLFEIPRTMAPNHDLHELGEEIHEVLGYVLLVLVLVHVVAAVYHHFIVKDSVLRRMSSRFSIGLFVLLLGGLLFFIIPDSKSASPPNRSESPAPPMDTLAAAGQKMVSAVTTESWNIDYEQSFIRFTGEQAGAEFSGLWTQWQGEIVFNPDPLIIGIDVEIDAAMGNTDDDERDATLKDPDWFDVANFPVARFAMDSASPNSDGSYTGTGNLTLKNRTTPAEFTFDVSTADGVHTLTGQAHLDRLLLNIGTGEWTDTSWVGQFVKVDVRVITR